MPKIIENIRENALAEARKELLADGYRGMTLRRVAGALGIALGTVYNYFPSKEYLAAGVMLEDWQELSRGFEARSEGMDVRSKLAALFEMVRTFTERYSLSWAQYEDHKTAESMRVRYHDVLVKQFAGYLTQAFQAENTQTEPWLAPFLAELLLRFGSDGHSRYEDLKEAVEKLLS
ncbi:MAG: TetR/AcrR family transcriptional regulator [Lachnospiraceae bacterium]|nr:TetR/AcrR family transcriptional regulator [Lachnospiraceae bacterium]